MIVKFKHFLFEDADIVKDGDVEICSCVDEDARAFGYYKRKMLVGCDNRQWHSYLANYKYMCDEPYKTLDTYNDFVYPGRLWVDKKIISFWKYPPKSIINKVLDDIKKAHDEIRGKYHIFYKNGDEIEVYNDDPEINWNDDWVIEIHKYKKNSLVPLSKYIGSENKINMANAHLNWRLKQELKKMGWGKGFGSHLTAWDSKNPIYWRQAKYQESKNYDSDLF